MWIIFWIGLFFGACLLFLAVQAVWEYLIAKKQHKNIIKKKYRRTEMTTKSVTDWICNHCGSINHVGTRKCYMCFEKKQGNEKRL